MKHQQILSNFSLLYGETNYPSIYPTPRTNAQSKTKQNR